MQEWLSDSAWVWISLASALMLVLSPALVAWFVVRLPSDYFAPPSRAIEALSPQSCDCIQAAAHEVSARWRWGSASLLKVLARGVKNLLGVVLFLSGIAMLVLPGQGVLTMAVGLLVMDFPGKRRLERRLVQRPATQRAMNWLRYKAKRPPLQF